MDGHYQKVTEENKPNDLVILNPTMKEIEKFEQDTIDDDDELDILGDFKKSHERDENKDVKLEIDNEEDEAYINQIHRMSMRKLKIGRMRSKLIHTSLSKDKYIDEVNIDKERAVRMADNIFKRRLKFLNKIKSEKDFNKNTSGNFQFSPQPFIKRLLSGNDLESNDINSKINEKRTENTNSVDKYKNNVIKTEYNVESYDNKSNNRRQKVTNAKEINANANKNTITNPNIKTLTRGNINYNSYTNIRNNNITISTRGNRNNNQNLIQNGNRNVNVNVNVNKIDNRKAMENKDIKDKKLNRNNNRVMSHTNIFEVNRTNPQIINSPRINEANTSSRRQANITNITTEKNISNISSPRSPRNIIINNIKANAIASPTRNNVIQVSNSTRGNRNNPIKIAPIPLPLDKMNKQLANEQGGNNTSRGYNRPYISKPLGMENKNSNNNRRNQNKVESNVIYKNDNKTITNEPRRRNANIQINSRQTGNLPVKTEVKNYPNTSRGNEKNRINAKNQVAKTSRGNERNKVEIKSQVAISPKSPKGNERNKVAIKNQAAISPRGNERNKVEIKNQTTYNRKSNNNQTGLKSPGKVENKYVVTTTTSGRRGRK